MKNSKKTLIVWLVTVALMVLCVGALLNGSEIKSVEYSEVLRLFQDEQVVEFQVDRNDTLTMKLQDGSLCRHKLRDVSIFYADLHEEISRQSEAGIITKFNYDSITVSIWVQLLPYVFVIVLFVAIWWAFIARTSKGGSGGLGGRMNSFSKARTKLGSDEKNKVFFRDVAGADEEKEELREVVDFLRTPEKFSSLGARIPKGVLLVGPPGTGKTLLAKAVAGESGVPFYSISGSDFVEMYVGVGASRVRDLFENAKKTAPCIIFIDEIDAIGRRRTSGGNGGQEEREQTLNQLLVEMDGFGVNDGVIVMAATNRPDILDSALTRPGRFDRQVNVNLPDLKGRIAILKVHARNKPLGDDVNLEEIARTTVGMTGADLANILNEAALLAARRKKSKIHMDDIEDATLKTVVGPQKHLGLSEEEKRSTAYHEAGHAIVGHVLETQDPVKLISIIPSGGALGYTLSTPEKDKVSTFSKELRERIAMLLGGRAAEKIILGDVSTGASADINQASRIARNMVIRFGMSETIGPIEFTSQQDDSASYGIMYSEQIASQIDEEVRRLIKDGEALAEKVLTEHMEILHFVAGYLVKHETMDAEQFALCFAENVTEAQLSEIKERKEQQRAVNNASESSDASDETSVTPEGKTTKAKHKAPESDDDFS